VSKPQAQDDEIALYTYLLLGKREETKSAQRREATMAKEAAQNGVSWTEVKLALKEYELTPQARQAKAERQAAIYRAVGAPVQLEMFDSYVSSMVNDTEAEARRRGRFAAICHQECSPPYEPGSPEGQAWMNGWHAVLALANKYYKRFELAADAVERAL